MPSYTLRDIPEILWRQTKAAAALRGESLNAMIIRLLEKEVESMGLGDRGRKNQDEGT